MSHAATGATTTAGSRLPANRTAVLTVAALFFTNGFVFSNWLPRIPEVRDRLGVGTGGLGTALIGGGIGGICASMLASRVFDRFNSSRVVVVCAISLAALLPVIALVTTPLALMLLLSALGFLDVFTDIAMNTQGVIVQGRVGRSIMHRLHACWSVGFTSGALVGWIASAAKLSMRTHLGLAATAMIAMVLVCRRNLTSPDPRTDGHTASAARGDRAKFVVSTTVVATAVMAVGVAFLEATPNDWSALALHDVFHTVNLQGLGGVLFAGSMLVGRLVGDHVLERLGVQRLINLALGLAVGGALLVVVAPVLAVAVAGFAIWGLGVSVMFPQLYSLAATLPGTSPGAGLGAMAVGQRSGFLLAPVLVGTVAEWRNLRWSFALIATAAAVFVVVSRRFVAPSTP